jgi:hypothetical protein
VRTLEKSIDIAARPEEVWAVLVDFENYSRWNPFIVEAAGEARAGVELTLRMRPPGGRPVTVRPRIQSVDRDRRLIWVGRLFVPGLWDVEHVFLLQPMPNGTHLKQSETIRGLLVSPLRRTIARTEKGFAEFNRALKKRVESSVVAGS